MKPMKVCCAGVLMLGLAACGGGSGGGGGGGEQDVTMMPMPTPEAFTVEGGSVAKAIGEETPIEVTAADPAPFAADGETLTENPVTDTDMTDNFAKSEIAPIAIEGWEGSVFTRSQMGGTVVTTVVNYTDIVDQAYSEYYSPTAAPSRVGVTSASSAGVLALDNAEFAMFEVNTTGFTAPGNIDFNMDSRPGSFNGIDGTFGCAATCTFVLNADGDLTGMTGDWTFTPTGDVADLTLEGAEFDEDYMNLAVWLVATEGADEPVYEIGTHAHSNEVDGYGSVAAVQGKAEYAGPATGIYIRKTFHPDGRTDPIGAGQFLADATLTANFGGTGVAVDEHFSIDGTVANFRDGSGQPIEGWSLTLGGTMLGGRAGITEADGTFSGVVEGTGPDGTWSGLFHGDNAEDALPGSATGVFHGHFRDGHVAGAFGVSRK